MISEAFRERFQKMAWQKQLGNLASTLGRVSTSATHAERDDMVTMGLREAAYFIEWSAPQVPKKYWLELTAMQREILAWRRVWPLEGARPLLALHARNQSDRLLHLAGYWDEVMPDD